MDVSVKKLSEILKIDPEILLEKMINAGLQQKSVDDLVSNEDKQKLVIKYKNKQFLFKENIYLFNSYAENEIFAQRRSILLNSFLEFNEKSNMLTEVNSWLYKVTKDDYICKKSDSSKGYK